MERRLLTLGAATVVGSDGQSQALQPRRLALLAVLARAGERGVSRERLVQLFWPDEEDEKARRALAQALYALRRDLGDEGAVVGTQQVRLDGTLLPSDVALFAAHVKSGHLEEAAALYRGPFLQGFHLLAVPAFERWADEERTVLAREHARVVERLATAASRDGRFVDAAGYWRILAATDPLDARVTVSLMEALEAAGDRAGALKQGRIYEALVQQELELPPDRAVVELAARLRAEPPREVVVNATTVSAPDASASAASTTVSNAALAAPASRPSLESDNAPTHTVEREGAAPLSEISREREHAPQRRVSWGVLAALAASAALVATVYAGTREREPRPQTVAVAGDGSSSVLAVGRIMDYRTGTPAPAGAVIDLLSTDLARIPGMQVLSNARMMELAHQLGGTDQQDLSAAAARAGGASELLEGSVQRHTDGQLQLDLRRVAVATGTVRAAYRVVGGDVFALVRDATDSVAAGARRSLSPNSGATVNPVAFGFYEQGLRAMARGNQEEGARFFALAVGADSSFVLGIYYLWQATEGSGHPLEPAVLERLAMRASADGSTGERERLLLRTASAYANRQTAKFLPLADSLIARYPNEVEGYYLRAHAEMVEAHYARALLDLRRVLAMDSLSLRGGTARCRACDARALIVEAYVGMDSLSVAQRFAESWVAESKDPARALGRLAEVYGMQGRADLAIATYQKLMAIATPLESDAGFVAAMRLRAGDVRQAETAARTLISEGNPRTLSTGWLLLGLTLREAGRPREAQETLHRFVLASRPVNQRDYPSFFEAQVMLEQGRAAEAGRLWLAALRGRARAGAPPSLEGWAMAATSFAHAGDAAQVAQAVDSATAVEQRLGTDVAAHQARHARAMLALVHADTTTAIAQLEAARYAPTRGFTRTYFELAKLYAARGRHADALAAVSPALHAPMSGPSAWVAHVDLHALAARACEQLGRRADAKTHWQWIASALMQPESSRQTLHDEAVARLAALSR